MMHNNVDLYVAEGFVRRFEFRLLKHDSLGHFMLLSGARWSVLSRYWFYSSIVRLYKACTCD